MKKLISLFIVATLCNITCFAQFYDNDDEIVFYEIVSDHGNITTGDFYAFNFAGTKAAVFGFYHFENVAPYALKDEMYFEKKVFGDPDLIYFSEEETTSYKVVYREVSSYLHTEYIGLNPQLLQSVRTEVIRRFIFNRDRSILTTKDSLHEWRWERRSKEEIYKRMRDAQSEKNKSWRDRTSDNNTLYE